MIRESCSPNAQYKKNHYFKNASLLKHLKNPLKTYFQLFPQYVGFHISLESQMCSHKQNKDVTLCCQRGGREMTHRVKEKEKLSLLFPLLFGGSVGGVNSSLESSCFILLAPAEEMQSKWIATVINKLRFSWETIQCSCSSAMLHSSQLDIFIAHASPMSLEWYSWHYTILSSQIILWSRLIGTAVIFSRAVHRTSWLSLNLNLGLFSERASRRNAELRFSAFASYNTLAKCETTTFSSDWLTVRKISLCALLCTSMHICSEISPINWRGFTHR